MNGISKIEIILENCEVITIEGKYIGAFDVSNIHTSISRMGCNHIGKMQCCESFIIEIYRDANVINKPFGYEDEDQTKIFERIALYNDITSIEVYYDKKDDDYKDVETGECDCIYVPYEELNENQLGSPNKYQSTHINKYGDLYIVIDKGNKISDKFDLEEINDKVTLNSRFSMYDIID